MEGYHSSVLFKEVIDSLDIKSSERYLDATLGDGGYSIEILKRGGKVIGVDVDPQAIERTRKRFEKLGISKEQYKLVQGNFRDIKNITEQTDIGLGIAGAIFDLGVSSLQLETPDRGFSFAKDAPLDMRMDPTLQVRALDLINGLNKGELDELFKKLGEEKYSRPIADALVFERGIRPIKSTKELADIAWKIYRRFGNKEKIHPATRVFQALRIAVNDELHALEEGLLGVKDLMADGGKVVVISFHSLEDRIVKNTFKAWEKQGIGEILTNKPVVPTKGEIDLNPRSRSSKMRVFRIKA